MVWQLVEEKIEEHEFEEKEESQRKRGKTKFVMSQSERLCEKSFEFMVVGCVFVSG